MTCYCLSQTMTDELGWPFASAPLAVIVRVFPSFETTDLIVMTTWPDFLNATPNEFEPVRRIEIVSAPLNRSSRQVGRPDPVIGESLPS